MDEYQTMRRTDVIALLAPRRDEIAQRFGVRSLSLFGSVARDEARPDSDVDVLVEFNGPTTFDGHMGHRADHAHTKLEPRGEEVTGHLQCTRGKWTC